MQSTGYLHPLLVGARKRALTRFCERKRFLFKSVRECCSKGLLTEWPSFVALIRSIQGPIPGLRSLDKATNV
ncbi:MAG TPA: hypothetical protein DDZ51_16320 [Planctomycetaceae bacterium]|nr:hypothetical protein [Planctomycetaceae bacterium]